MAEALPYDIEFFRLHQPQSENSARIVLTLILGWLRPGSLVDVGCGLGTWARVAFEFGVPDVYGIDGDYIDREQLEIPESSFMAHDLAQPFDLGRRFDIALCLEVAEHLPESRSATLVADLCRTSDVVVFSAAIPGQGGTDHRNEQWQSYWAELFEANGYRVLDIVRSRIWRDERVAWWFRQNMFVAAKSETTEALEKVAEKPILDCVHPALLQGRTTPEQARASMSLRTLLSLVPEAALRAIRRRVRPRGE